MWRTIDGRSLLIGGLLVAVAVCAMGALPLVRQPLRNGEYNGRFSLTAADSGEAYVIDTVTGQVWAKHYPDSFLFYAPKAGHGDYLILPAEPNQSQP